VTVTEYLAECWRDSEPWIRWPRRMLRHKALIQCARYAFGFSGIIDQDEYERLRSAPMPSSVPPDVRADAVTDAEITTAAEADPDNPPLTEAEFARARLGQQSIPPGEQPHQPTPADHGGDEGSVAIPDVAAVPSQYLAVAYSRGQDAKREGLQRKAMPPEYRDTKRIQEQVCWQAGFDGHPMPTFKDAQP
jgi:RecT family